MHHSLPHSTNTDIMGEDFASIEDDVHRVPQRSHYSSKLAPHFSSDRQQLQKPMIRVHSSYAPREPISDLRSKVLRYSSQPMGNAPTQRFNEAQKPGTRIVLVPRGNIVGSRDRPMPASTSRGVIRVDSTGNRFIQFPNGSVSQIKTRTVSEMAAHRGPRYIVPNERNNSSHNFSSRPLLFDFEADEAKDREISEAIAREEELMRLEEERNNNASAGYEEDYRYLQAINTSSNDTYNRTWQSEGVRQKRFSSSRTSHTKATTTLYSSPTQLYGTDSKDVKICKMVLASIVNQVCGVEENEQRDHYRNVEVNPPDIVTLECLPSFYNQRVALNRRYPIHQRQPEECLVEHIENYKREVNRRRAVLENIAQEELGMLLPWRRTRTKNLRAIRKLRDSEDAMCDPRLISLGGNTTETKDVTFKMESSASNDDPSLLPSVTANDNNQFGEEKESQENILAVQTPKQGADTKRNKRNLQSSSNDKTDSEDQEGGKKIGGKRVHSVENLKKGGGKVQRSPPRKPISKRQHRLNQQDNDADDENEASGRSDVDGYSKYCICGNLSGPSDSKKFKISCSRCKSYFHGKCVGLTEKKAQKLGAGWTCADCEKQKSSTEELYCVCRQPYDDKRFYVGCDSCEDWFHPECINTTQQEISQFDEFICPKCRK